MTKKRPRRSQIDKAILRAYAAEEVERADVRCVMTLAAHVPPDQTMTITGATAHRVCSALATGGHPKAEE